MTRPSLAGRILLLLAVLALGLAACGDDDSSSADGGNDDGTSTESTSGDSESDEPEEMETVDLKVTSLGICNEVTHYWAQHAGFFEDQGLNVEMIRTGGGSAGIAAVTSGAADLAFANGFSAIFAIDEGIDLTYVSNIYYSATPPLEPANGVWVVTDSDIETAADLEGRTVAVNELGQVNEIITSEWIRQNGGDPSLVNYVALPFQNMTQALLGDQIEAFESSIRTAAGIRDDGSARSIGDPFHEMDRVLYVGFVGTSDWVAENADVAERFYNAMDAALEDWQKPENIDEAMEVISAECGNEPELLKEIPPPGYSTSIDPAVLDRMMDMMVDQGLIEAAPTTGDEMVASFATE